MSLLGEPTIPQIGPVEALGDVAVLGREDGRQELAELIEPEDGEQVQQDVYESIRAAGLPTLHRPGAGLLHRL